VIEPSALRGVQLDASGKQGRYVRIQLLDKDYLSLAEVQVMGVDPLRFSEVDLSSALSWYSRYQRVHLCRQHLNYPTP
jgi:hypothetical protein